MNPDEVRHALESLPDIEVSSQGDHVQVLIPGIADGPRLAAPLVHAIARTRGPKGERAIRFGIAYHGSVIPLIITSTDVVFTPAAPDDVLDARISYHLSTLPSLVAYSEMARDAQTLNRESRRKPGPTNLTGMGGDLLQSRCCIVGAIRHGLRPVLSVDYWEDAWSRWKEIVHLPPFHPDSSWRALCSPAQDPKRPPEKGTPKETKR